VAALAAVAAVPEILEKLRMRLSWNSTAAALCSTAISSTRALA